MRVPCSFHLIAMDCNSKKEGHELMVWVNPPLFSLTSVRGSNPGHLKSVVRCPMGTKLSLSTGNLQSCSSKLYFATPSFPYAL